ncbi:MAG: YhbY family RNA-binding protein [Polyangiaceae bacterium]|nr:YhbY family RNA-binding protein [Polyangiaceae bacterium]
MALSGKQIRHLRGLGHHLDPVVHIGKNGFTDALAEQMKTALFDHELIKVKLLPECPVDRAHAGVELAELVGAECVQTLGRTLLLWKRNAEKPKVNLPNAKGQIKEVVSKAASKGKRPSSRSQKKPTPQASDQQERPARPYRPRAEGEGDRSSRPVRPYRPRAEGEGDRSSRPARPYRPRAEGEGDRSGRPARPYRPRSQDSTESTPRRSGPPRSGGPRSSAPRSGGPRKPGPRKS